MSIGISFSNPVFASDDKLNVPQFITGGNDKIKLSFEEEAKYKKLADEKYEEVLKWVNSRKQGDIIINSDPKPITEQYTIPVTNYEQETTFLVRTLQCITGFKFS